MNADRNDIRDPYIDHLDGRRQRLMDLIVLGIFIVVVAFSLWSMHARADQPGRRFDSEKRSQLLSERRERRGSTAGFYNRLRRDEARRDREWQASQPLHIRTIGNVTTITKGRETIHCRTINNITTCN